MQNENNNEIVTENITAPAESTPPTPEPPVAGPINPPNPPLSYQGGETPELEPAPASVSTPASTPAPTPAPSYTEVSEDKANPSGLSSLLTRAKEKIQFRKRAKLEKIVGLAQSKRKITNDDIQKFLRVSDATATRYLSELVKLGRLKRVGPAKQPFYQINQ